MTVRRRGKNWYFRKWVRVPGKTPERIYGVPETYGLPNTKVGAVEACRMATGEKLADIQRPREHGKSPTPTVAVLTVAEFASTYLDHSDAQNKPSTVDSKRQILASHILPAFRDTPLREVNYRAIEDFKLSLRDTLGPKTINNVLTVLRRMLALAVKRGEIESVPEVEWLRAPVAGFDFFTFAEAESLLAKSADSEWHVMFLVALRTGMRIGELLGLRWIDVDLKAGRLVVRQAVARGRVGTPKSHRAREIPLSATALAVLVAHQHNRSPLVFCRNDGSDVTRSAARAPLYFACDRAGLRRVGWHVLRHTFASHLVMKGIPLNTVRELLGHSTIKMTERYAHLSPQVTANAVMVLD